MTITADHTVTPKVARRQKIEKAICRRFILDALKAGYNVSVYDGQEIVAAHATTAKACLDVMFTVDEEQLIVYDADNKRVGWVALIYGNDGWDVITDYHTRLEPLMKGAEALSNKYMDRA